MRAKDEERKIQLYMFIVKIMWLQHKYTIPADVPTYVYSVDISPKVIDTISKCLQKSYHIMILARL